METLPNSSARIENLESGVVAELETAKSQVAELLLHLEGFLDKDLNALTTEDLNSLDRLLHDADKAIEKAYGAAKALPPDSPHSPSSGPLASLGLNIGGLRKALDEVMGRELGRAGTNPNISETGARAMQQAISTRMDSMKAHLSNFEAGI